MQKQTIYIGSDHGGFEQKHDLIVWLRKNGYAVEDTGPSMLDLSDDYPEYAFAVAQAVQKANENTDISEDPVAFGILTCRSAAGMNIAANKVPGVRAVAVTDERGIIHAREHNNANVLALSGDWLSQTESQELVNLFLNTAFTAHERHIRRITQIHDFELSKKAQ